MGHRQSQQFIPLGTTGFTLQPVLPCPQPCVEVYAYLFRGQSATGRLSYHIMAENAPISAVPGFRWTLIDCTKASDFLTAEKALRRRHLRLPIG